MHIKLKFFSVSLSRLIRTKIRFEWVMWVVVEVVVYFIYNLKHRCFYNDNRDHNYNRNLVILNRSCELASYISKMLNESIIRLYWVGLTIRALLILIQLSFRKGELEFKEFVRLCPKFYRIGPTTFFNPSLHLPHGSESPGILRRRLAWNYVGQSKSWSF